MRSESARRVAARAANERGGPSRRRRLGPALLLALAICACGERERQPDAKPETVAEDPLEQARARVDEFVDEPSWAGLIELLGQDHAAARELLGPHHLHYKAHFYTGPVAIAKDEPLPPVDVDEPIYERFEVDDELDLRWAATAKQPARFHLAQHTDDERKRELIVIDERAWSALDTRGWHERPLESDLWQLWLDDAQHAALDLAVLAGPAADIEAVEELADHGGRPALRVSLRASDTAHPDRVDEALEPWRREAEIELISGEFVIDRATGLWLAADVELRWSFEDRAGRALTGQARLEGSVEVLAEAPEIAPPPEAQPVPERERPELLRERLLDGLAGP